MTRILCSGTWEILLSIVECNIKEVKTFWRLFIVAATILSSGLANAQELIDSAKVWMDELQESLPKVSPYYLQHQYLSVVASMIGEKDGEMILDSSTILNSLSPIGNGFLSPFKDEEISVERFEVDGKIIFVWSFPESEYLREALYMAFIPVDGKYRAYAISIGASVDWEISTSTESYRETFGRVPRPGSAKECLDILIERGALTGKISPGEFFQEGYKSPCYRPM